MPTAATLEIGVFKAHETQLLCKGCGQIYFSEELRKFIPDQCKFGIDVISSMLEKRFFFDTSMKEKYKLNSTTETFQSLSGK
ncbi:MAG: hypothetical protein GY782_02920 [Gammaproteobacteria bacterium]|nr:hypothetical protein [Gammaproteobacteria bacterium]